MPHNVIVREYRKLGSLLDYLSVHNLQVDGIWISGDQLHIAIDANVRDKAAVMAFIRSKVGDQGLVFHLNGHPETPGQAQSAGG